MTELRPAFDPLELAALGHAWELWARPKQLAPETDWRSFGFVTGRGFGKTRSCAELVVEEVLAGRARRIGFCSFNLDEAERTLIHGVSGLLAVSPPWFKPEVIKGQVVWPNGAIATPYTPEVPDGPRGPEHDLFWCSEVSSWPDATRVEFFKNIRYGLRLGLGRMIYDTTPKARNPMVRYLLQRVKRDPVRHIVVRGSTGENADNLTSGFLDELRLDYDGTQTAAEEEHGEFRDDAEGALWKADWISNHRRALPSVLRRRIISIDPAISNRKGTDETGIATLGLGTDEQAYVIGDYTDRYQWEAWGELVIKLYFEGRCDCVVVERNRGGDAVAANIRACGKEQGITVVLVGADEATRHLEKTIFVKEVVARKSKGLRAEPVASLYKAGRVSHVIGADLADLEDTMCTWEPNGGGPSPNALDAVVHGVTEIAGLGREGDRKSQVVGAAKLMEQVAAAPRPRAPNIAALIGVTRRSSDRL